MTEILLFHHTQGLTPGVRAFADDLRAGGHIVHTPDLFDGRTFQSIDEGLAYIGEIGFDEMRERGVRVADELPPELVYAGFSFGVLPAQKLAQTRPGARGAPLFCSCLPISGGGPSDPGRMASRSRSTVWRTIRSSSARATSTPPARLWRRSRTQSCSCIPAIGTTSPTAHFRRTTRMRPRYSPTECLSSWIASELCRYAGVKASF